MNLPKISLSDVIQKNRFVLLSNEYNQLNTTNILNFRQTRCQAGFSSGKGTFEKGE
jgi:hypothetical protein